ncbi:prephenate/arogenate dehydrogenase family protein [Ferrovibrio sp.]|uniref:prephenate/arogenate dehydrogenase family protein n=1 Tax=Ferrovibrio sp. TaxID=1917215 RepID=UPI0035B4B8AF
MGADALFKRLAIIGIGLIGSSVARAARQFGQAERIVCADLSPENRAEALRLGVVDEAFADPADAVRGADLVLLSIPLGAYGAVGQAMAPGLTAGTLITDVGSCKQSVLRDLAPHLPPGVSFIPGHPVAGTEHSGPAAGFAELFRGRWCILTPTDEAPADKLESLRAFWAAFGSKVEMMDARHHDMVLAITSHVPHLIAYNIVGTADDLQAVTQSEVIKYSAGGFRDFTRIAASDPTMWRDVFLNNKEAVLEMLQRFTEDLTALQRAIRWDDGDTLFKLFSRTRTIRRAIIDAGQETAAADFGRDKADKA